MLGKLYQYIFYIIFLLIFLLGGFLQFIIGIPNTIITYLIVSLLIAFYIIYVLVKKKIYFNKVLGSLILLIIVILLSAIINKTYILKTIIYMVFAFLPLGVYLFFKVNQKENYISHIKLSKLYLFISCIQYPIILIQTYGFDYIIPFSRSSQYIASFDFLFGSFFLKADHALGFFLLLNILNILNNNKNREITKYPIPIYVYLGFTILSSESNISKLLLIFLIAYLTYKSFPRKIKTFGFVLIIIASLFAYPHIKKMRVFEREIEFMKEEYNVEKSYRNYKNKIAKRAQIMITYSNKLPLKWFGEGPYSYFNIMKGKFTQTKHFSQLLWTYNDLGIIGLIVVIFSMIFIVFDLDVSFYVKVILLGAILIYSFMTTIFSDLAIMVSLTSILRKNNKL
jgi:hypothetical protein